MGRNRDGDGIKSSLIVSEVQKRACLYDSSHPHYGDRTAKSRCWEEVCQKVVPGWYMLDQLQKFSAGKEVQKRWRSIRDSFTKAYRQGKCVLPEQCPPASRRYQHHKQMAFLLRALQNKKPRLSQEKDRYESFSEVSSSPNHQPIYELPQMAQLKPEAYDKPLDLKTRPDKPLEKPEALLTDKNIKEDKESQTNLDKENIDMKNQLEIKLDANSILPDDHFDDDKLFMNSLLPLFRKMDDDTRLLCRIEVLKIIRYALQGSKCFEALKIAEDSFFKKRLTGILNEQTDLSHGPVQKTESSLSMVTRSADGSRPMRKRRHRSPSPLPMPIKRRGPGRPRKIRPPPSDSDEESISRRRPKLKVAPLDIPSELDDSLNKATSITQLSTPMFMKMYNLERTKTSRISTEISALNIKTEPDDESQT